ncbi:MAG: hypothetical protein BroJett011_59320 [Chloroflexota bacterium]|nr:MAG: hypothetical protein BroJett011_59320 [Chloroflexota bacterium]
MDILYIGCLVTMSAPINTPTQHEERIFALDVVRGFAILGILIMNIQSFSMIEATYLNPTAYGDFTGLNRWIWIFSHLLADQKFITIFSLLFGAGIVLFTGRIEAKGHSSLGLHYRRTFWLLVIGLLHSYLFWSGDILVTYALCAMVMVLYRKWPPILLLIVGSLVFTVASLLYLFLGFSLPHIPREAYEEIKLGWQSSPELIERELTTYRSSWLDQMPLRVAASFRFQIFGFLIYEFWRVSGLMLIGMALFKWGIFTAERSRRFYILLAVVGLGVGFPIVVYGIVQNFAANWTVDYSMFLGSQFNYWASLLVSLGYCGVIVLVVKTSQLRPIANMLSAVGQMALTNYLLQTIISTTLFYGHGLGLYGQVERSGQILIVIGIWTVQLIISPLWLRYYRFGPAEWLWRSLTYWQIQAFREVYPAMPTADMLSAISEVEDEHTILDEWNQVDVGNQLRAGIPFKS